MQFTKEQQKVIDTRNCSILVSAAAGSGKTAVLVERIIRMITDEEKPVDIDRLLVVTFTSAAATQMRERISAAISALLESNPENEHLQRQSSLIYNAQITTIDSFCLWVIKNNFNEIGLDPGFRVADEGEVRLIENDVMERLMEDAHTDPSDSFLRLVESYAQGISEKRIEESVRRLYSFAVSYPFPEEWLLQRKLDYGLDSLDELEDKEWFAAARGYIGCALEECRQLLLQGMELASGACGPEQYLDNLKDDMDIINGIDVNGTYSDMYKALNSIKFSRLSSKKNPEQDLDLKESVKEIRADVKKIIEDIHKRFFVFAPEDMADDMKKCREAVGELIELTLEYKRRLDTAKRERNIIDFTDMEHFALDILVRKDEDGNIVPRNAALEYQEYYEEIMIDEYQDSNEVQEVLLLSISGEKSGRYNRFMVGDVKQSIYKFRLAKPEIFMKKYDSYVILDDDVPNAGELKNVRIDLSRNFRSRREVTDAVNFICGRLMTKQVGNVEYDEKSALYAAAAYPSELDERFESLIYGEKTGNVNIDGKNTDSINTDNKNADGLNISDIYKTQVQIATKAAAVNDSGETNKYSEKEMEAKMVAAHIKQLVGRLPVTDAQSGVLRPAKYSDIVLLFRTTLGWDEVFSRILSEEGIPVYVSSRTGYFETYEIQAIVNILKILDNPLQDIALFGVMKLAYFDFTDEDIAKIKSVTDTFASQEEKEKNKGAELFLYDRIKLYRQLVYAQGDEDWKNIDEENIDKKIIDEENIADENNYEKTVDAVDYHKINRFFDFISDFREKMAYIPIKELLLDIMRTTSFVSYAAAMPGGDRRLANLELLLEKAGSFQNTSFYGLFHFIRYLETIKEQEVDFGEANTLDENADVVRIMTIHKSKGLEFPICFVCGLSKQFNQMDMRQPVLIDAELGIGIDSIDTELMRKRRTLRKNVVAQKLKEEARGEDLRVLYVALTRAKEKLILTGYIEDLDKKLGSLRVTAKGKNEKLSYNEIMSANSYMELILAALSGHECMRDMLADMDISGVERRLPYQDAPIGFSVWSDYDDIKRDFLEMARTAELEMKLKEAKKFADEGAAKELGERLKFTYEYEHLKGLSVKTTVSELKRAAYDETYEQSDGLVEIPRENYVPHFASECGEDTEKTEKSGARYGTAVHRVMELLPFDGEFMDYMNKIADKGINKSAEVTKALDETIEKEKNIWLSEKKISVEDAELVSARLIARFLESPLASKMAKAYKKGCLFREQPFVLGVPASRLNPLYPDNETVLVQGVIDAFFYENGDNAGGEIILADYKTDNIAAADELIERYRAQLDYYQLAIEQITGARVKEKYLYSFKLGREIICP